MLGTLPRHSPPYCARQVVALVRDCMEGAAPEVTVPLRVQLRAGRSWGELEPFELQPLPETEDAVGPSLAAEPAPMAAAADGGVELHLDGAELAASRELGLLGR